MNSTRMENSNYRAYSELMKGQVIWQKGIQTKNDDTKFIEGKIYDNSDKEA